MPFESAALINNILNATKFIKRLDLIPYGVKSLRKKKMASTKTRMIIRRDLLRCCLYTFALVTHCTFFGVILYYLEGPPELASKCGK